MWQTKVGSLILAVIVAALPCVASAGSFTPSIYWSRTWVWDETQEVMRDAGVGVVVPTKQHFGKRTALGDVNGDGSIDSVESVWRPGKYGSVKPRWIRSDTTENLPHIDVLHPVSRYPIWQSSAIDLPVCSQVVRDMNKDGLDDLIVVEGRFQTDIACQGQTIAVWESTGWGFQLLWRSQPSRFGWISISKNNNRPPRIFAGLLASQL